MRSTTSSSQIRTILRDNYKKYWTVPAIGLFMLLCWGFIPMILSGDIEREMIISMTHNANVGYVISMLIIAIGSGMAVFSYLQNPGASNYIHGMPVNRKKLFSANVISGLLMIAGPLLVNGLLMCFVTGNPLFLKWMVVSAIGCFAIFAITAFAAMVSGNTLMHLFNAVLFNGIVSIIALVFQALCMVFLIGYAQPEGWTEFLLRSNALTAFIGEGMAMPMIWIVYMLVGILALVLSWITYQKRPIERTGESVVFYWTRVVLYILCVFAGTVLIGIFFADILNEQGMVKFGHNMLIGMVCGGLFVFLVGSIMMDRTAKIFTKRNLVPAAIAFVLALGTVTAFGEDIMGYNDNIPAASDVKAVYVDTTSDVFSLYDKDNNMYSFPSRAVYYENDGPSKETPGGERVLGMTGSESIGAAIHLQKTLLNQDWKSGYPECYVGIVYELKNGKSLRRNYPAMLLDQDAERFEFNAAVTEAANQYCVAKEFKDNYSVQNVREKYFEKGVVTVYPTGWSGEGDSIVVSGKDVAGLKEALNQDLKDETAGMYEVGVVITGSTKASLKEDEYSESEEITIAAPKNGKHTNAWLKAYQKKLK